MKVLINIHDREYTFDLEKYGKAVVSFGRSYFMMR